MGCLFVGLKAMLVNEYEVLSNSNHKNVMMMEEIF